MNKQKGNMYGFVTHTWNPVKGKCPYGCGYCFMLDLWKRLNSEKQILDEKCLKDNLGEGNFIFVGSSTDMFAESVPTEWINMVLNYCAKFKLNKYLFQSKNPERMNKFVFPDNSIIGTTIETNRDNSISKAPYCSERLFSIKTNPNPRMVTIEPIMDFDLKHFVEMIKNINPKWINIGADSKGHKLPEPSKEKIEDLVKELKKFTEVKLKDNLKRLM